MKSSNSGQTFVNSLLIIVCKYVFYNVECLEIILSILVLRKKFLMCKFSYKYGCLLQIIKTT